MRGVSVPTLESERGGANPMNCLENLGFPQERRSDWSPFERPDWRQGQSRQFNSDFEGYFELFKGEPLGFAFAAQVFGVQHSTNQNLKIRSEFNMGSDRLGLGYGLFPNWGCNLPGDFIASFIQAHLKEVAFRNYPSQKVRVGKVADKSVNGSHNQPWKLSAI